VVAEFSFAARMRRVEEIYRRVMNKDGQHPRTSRQRARLEPALI
jgi:hypothetical protein